MITDVLTGPGEETAAAIRTAGGKADFRAHDVRDDAAWADAVTATIETFGGFDILVNNAGIEETGVIAEFEIEAFQRLFDVNVTGAALWLCSDAASFITGVGLPVDGGMSQA